MSNASVYQRYLQAAGFSSVASNSIVAGGISESGLDPNAVGDNGTAFGINQWRGTRKRNLDAFAARRGTSWNDFNTQMAFTVHELQTTETGAASKLSHAASLQQGVNAFLSFLRPRGYSNAAPQNSDRYTQRVSDAQSISGGGGDNTLSGGTDSETTSTGNSFIDALFSFISGASGVSPIDGGVAPGQSITSGEYGTDDIYSLLKTLAAPLAIIVIAFLLFVVGIMSLAPKGN